LAHLVDTDAKYTDFYAQMSDRGDFIICDNGAFELGESYHPDKLIQLAQSCKAHALVLPDYPWKPGIVTIEAAKNLIPKVKSAGFKTMFVPQSEEGNVKDWIETYKWAANNDDVDIIGMSILGIPIALSHLPKVYARVVMTQILIEQGVFNFNKHHHYLGLNAGPGLEIPPLIKMKALHSCDSSNPVWHGILGHEYSLNTDSLLPVSKVKMEVQFNLPWIRDVDTHRRIQTNIDLTLNLFENKKRFSEDFENKNEVIYSLLSQTVEMNGEAVWHLLNKLPVTKFIEPLKKALERK
jgi:hypothetical protein